jgi:predicted RNA-binding Zn-ribbon protein involved in translation (DUF1610 family)
MQRRLASRCLESHCSIGPRKRAKGARYHARGLLYKCGPATAKAKDPYWRNNRCSVEYRQSLLYPFISSFRGVFVLENSSALVWLQRYVLFHCDDCGSETGYRSRARTFPERYLLPLCLLQPVRCGECFRRDYRPIFMPLRDRLSVVSAKPAAAVTRSINTRNVA